MRKLVYVNPLENLRETAANETSSKRASARLREFSREYAAGRSKRHEKREACRVDACTLCTNAAKARVAEFENQDRPPVPKSEIEGARPTFAVSKSCDDLNLLMVFGVTSTPLASVQQRFQISAKIVIITHTPYEHILHFSAGRM